MRLISANACAEWCADRNVSVTATGALTEQQSLFLALSLPVSESSVENATLIVNLTKPLRETLTGSLVWIVADRRAINDPDRSFAMSWTNLRAGEHRAELWRLPGQILDERDQSLLWPLLLLSTIFRCDALWVSSGGEYAIRIHSQTSVDVFASSQDAVTELTAISHAFAGTDVDACSIAPDEAWVASSQVLGLSAGNCDDIAELAEVGSPLYLLLRDYKELPGFSFVYFDSINVKGNFQDTPLHVAVHRDSVEEASLLLNAGADPNIPGEYGELVLHSAIQNKNAEFVKLLIRAGARLDLVELERDAFDIAELYGFETTLNDILRRVHGTTEEN